MAERALCQLCGQPMPEGEEMFNYHAYSGDCPKKDGVASEPAPTQPVWDECVGSHDEAEPAATPEQPIHKQNCAVFWNEPCNCGLEWKVPRRAEPVVERPTESSGGLTTWKDLAISNANLLKRAIARFDKAESELSSLRRELERERQRRFLAAPHTHSSHTTACSIWGDDGLGHTKEKFEETYPLPCNCGALINFERKQVEELKAALRHLNSTVKCTVILEDEQLREAVQRAHDTLLGRD